MKRLAVLFLAGLFLTGLALGFTRVSYGEEGSPERIPLIREAKESGKTTVAVEAFLIGNIMEVKVIARMHATKPKIHNAIIVGPRLGRLPIETKKVLLQATEEEAPFPTTKRGAFISFGKKTKDKKAKGTLTRELLEFDIPRDRVVKDKRYQLWIQVESMQRGGKYRTFKFDLENLAELLAE